MRRLARALASTLRSRDSFPTDVPASRGDTVFVGRDTRASGPVLHEQLASEFLAAGFDVADLGVLPTPGVAHFANVSPGCCLAIVLSASHNPAADNGIKVIAPDGTKISEAFELEVSLRYHEDRPTDEAATRGKNIDLSGEAFECYVARLVEGCERPSRIAGRRIFLDAANGAAFRTAPEVFRRLGAKVVAIGVDPNGENINEECGALHPTLLAERVREDRGSVGFCFDGDADRMIPVTGAGRVLDGDHVLALAARHYDRLGRLPNKTVVTTIMANVGLEKSLREMDLQILRTPVGDKHVHRAMVEGDHPIGGEQSGHLIFLDRAGTGDGTLAALRLLDVLESDDLDLERESAIVTKFPQVLTNVRVADKRPFEEVPDVLAAVAQAEERLGVDGRVVLRYSGTEPLARVMLEGPDQAQIDGICDEICGVIERSLA